MKLNIDIDVDDLVFSLDREEAEKLIKDIDKKEADWDFTLNIFEYLLHEVIKGAKNEPEIAHEIENIATRIGCKISVDF
jgi:hypothetical protein